MPPSRPPSRATASSFSFPASRGGSPASALSPASRSWASCPQGPRCPSSPGSTGPVSVPARRTSAAPSGSRSIPPRTATNPPRRCWNWRASTEPCWRTSWRSGASARPSSSFARRAPRDISPIWRGTQPDLSLEQKLEVLETLDIEKRLTRLIEWTKEDLGEADLKDRIRTEVAEGMQRTQREFILRQRLESSSRRGLGEGGDDVVATYRKRLADAGCRRRFHRGGARDRQAGPDQSAEFPSTAGSAPTCRLDVRHPVERPLYSFKLKEAHAVLDRDHTGLSGLQGPHHRVPRRPQALQGARNPEEAGGRRQDGRAMGAILCFVGPPGVGKTSLGQSIAARAGPQVHAHEPRRHA